MSSLCAPLRALNVIIISKTFGVRAGTFDFVEMNNGGMCSTVCGCVCVYVVL